MYNILLYSHSIIRWLVLLSLAYAIFKAYYGYKTKAIFSKNDQHARIGTVTIAHIQLTVGIILYTQSPLVKYFWSNFGAAIKSPDVRFFSLIHMAAMLLAVTVITIGSAKAKRATKDIEKFKTVLIWFSIALLIILAAIPWPFSPLAVRPYFR